MNCHTGREPSETAATGDPAKEAPRKRCVLRSMTKGQSLTLAIIFAILTIVCFATNLVACAVPFLIIATVYAAGAAYKQHRDTKLIQAAEAERMAAAQQLPPPPVRTSKGS